MGLVLGFVYGTKALQATLTVSAALGTAYSTDLPGLRWKKYPVLAAGCILSVRSVVVQVGFFSHLQERLPSPVSWQNCDPITFSVVFIFAFSVVIAFFKDLPDVAGDAAAGVRTMAVRVGVTNIFNGCVGALALNYVGAVLYCLFKANWLSAIAHGLLGAVLVNASGKQVSTVHVVKANLRICERANLTSCGAPHVHVRTSSSWLQRRAGVFSWLVLPWLRWCRWCRSWLGRSYQEVLHANLEVLLRRVSRSLVVLKLNARVQVDDCVAEPPKSKSSHPTIPSKTKMTSNRTNDAKTQAIVLHLGTMNEALRYY